MWVVCAPVPIRAQDDAGAGPLRVFVAASLADVAGEVARDFTANGGGEVTLVVDGTSRLVAQLRRGAAGDLLITADRAWMDEAASAGLVDGARTVARGSLVLVASADAAPPSAPLDAGSAIALLRASDRVALAGEEIPAGRYAREVLRALDALPPPARLATGGSVRTALEWTARGEADLGIVYASDARAEARVTLVHRFDPALHTPIEYRAAVLQSAARPAAAARFLEAIAGATGLLTAAGFEPAEDVVGSTDPETAGSALGDPTSVGTVAVTPDTGGPSLPSALLLSIVVAVFAVVVGTIPAVTVGRVLATRRIPGRALVSAVLLAPLVIPPVVTGFLLLSLFGAGSPVGGALAALGLRIPFTPLAAVLAAAVVGLPLYAVVVRAAFQAVDPRYEELSWTLGVPPRTTFRRVALPLAMPGIAAGAVLAFARALGEFGATIVVAGNVEGETRTIPLAVYSLLETPGVGGRIWFFVGASVVLSLGGLVLYEALLERQRRRMEDGRVG